MDSVRDVEEELIRSIFVFAVQDCVYRQSHVNFCIILQARLKLTWSLGNGGCASRGHKHEFGLA